MRVEVDQAICEANGVCESIAPEVFRLDEQDTLHILQPDFPEELREQVQDAVDRCPKVALRLTDGT